MWNRSVDVAVIGGGPAGMAAAKAASLEGALTLLMDREERLGGILKQCVHDGFGLIRYKSQMSGPSYAQREAFGLRDSGALSMTSAFVLSMERRERGFLLTVQSPEGIGLVEAKSVVDATGCRERTARQVSIHGDRPAGIFNAGCAQHMVNLKGVMPGRRCVVLGSGDIGLIMARRLTLEGATVIGVYEAKENPSGLERNIQQCLHDFSIPLHLSTTVTKVFGKERVQAVEIAKVDGKMRPIGGTEMVIPCDCLIVSVGLIPEIELAKPLHPAMDGRTQSVVTDQYGMSSVPGLFFTGNAQMVYDLVDLVSATAEKTGKEAALYSKGKPISTRVVNVDVEGELLFCAPDLLRLDENAVMLFFRSRRDLGPSLLEIRQGDRLVRSVSYERLHPPKMERVPLRMENLVPGGIVVSLRQKEGV